MVVKRRSAMNDGMRCPECGSWYSNDPTMLNSGMEVGEVCGNQAMTGPSPKLCSPDHPCPGILELVVEDDGDVLKKMKRMAQKERKRR
jgi:hypothetical protein